MNDKRQAGFDAVMIIIAIVVLAVLGVIGWKLYSSYNKPAAKTTSSQTGGSTQTNNTSTANQTMYSNIKELGIKLPLSNGISDLTYVATKNADSSYSLHFSTASIVAADPTCDAQADPLGIYTAYTSAQPNPGTTDAQSGTLEVQANGYYIYYKHTQFVCGNDAAAAKISDAIAPLLTAVQGAQKE